MHSRRARKATLPAFSLTCWSCSRSRRTLEDSTSRPSSTRMAIRVFKSGGREWPQNVDPSILVHEDATVENLSSYDLVTRHYPNEELVYIVIYDGVIVVDLSTDTNMSVSDAQELPRRSTWALCGAGRLGTHLPI